MKPTEKIESLLADLGYTKITLWYQKGAYRHFQWDLARWGGYAENPDGMKVHLVSWDTMTECARKGVNIRQDDRDHREMIVSPKSAKLDLDTQSQS